ncbi:MAG TPA: (2Fe-2S) ferredoxin domain-containing protein [Kamptonema sp.]|nr:(2Fe-2S) ferredoxin domain-containing protein [Kamptonema sp.]
MINSDNYSHREFSIEGQFLGLMSHGGKLKYIRLGVLSTEIPIKLPKAMRRTEGLLFQPGESIRVTGIRKLDPHTREVKLKATQIIPFSGCHAQIAPEIASTSVSSVTQEVKITPKIKVQICQKSGCLKRGGKGLCEALDRILCDRNLEQYVSIQGTGCVKRCSAAPNVVVVPGNHRFTEVSHKTLPKIADAIAQSLARPDK